MAAALFGKGIPIKSRSWVWKYFNIYPEDTSIAICNTCKLKVSREMIAVDIQLFSIVEDIRLYVLTIVYQVEIRQNIQKEINDASYISFTTDGWASTNGKCSFLSLTAHWLTNEFHQKSAVLRVCQFNVSHTTKNICEAIQISMNDFFIPASKVHLVAKDNAANMAAGIREAVPQNRFKQDIATKWNSQYFMLEKIFEQKRASIPFCYDNDNSKLNEGKAIASAIIPTAQVIPTMLVQAEKFPLFFGLGTILKECKNSANERFEKYFNDKNLILATFLDPRYKNNFFPTEEADSYFENIIKWLLDCSKSFQQNDHIEFQPEVSSSSIKKTSISEILQETESKHYIKLKNEVLTYLSQDIIMQQDSPIVWWGANRNNFKQLAPIAQKYLSCPPSSSVESERLFSCGGQIYSQRRSRLSSETGEMFLHYNFRIHSFKC
nr:zinc finger BED domain-containing protein 4-like [Hydra vulgaris]